jgi:hypothetical protein
MKKTVVTTFFLLFIVSRSFGQIDFGFKAGLNVSNGKYEGMSQYKSRLGFNAGAYSEINFNQKIFLRPELQYSVKGYKFPATAFSGAGTLSLNYITLPVLFGVRPVEELSFLLGPEFGFLANANSKFDGKDHDVKSNFQNIDIGVDVGASYRLTKRLGAELRYSYGFKGLQKSMFNTDNSGNIISGGTKNGSNRVFQVGLFYSVRK